MNFKKLLETLKPTKGQMELAKAFIPSAAIFGMAGGLGIIYFTDWRVITDYIPLYNTKYPKPEKSSK
ncbi:cytochrome b-c1 complex subunit 10 [Drosophila grimshawi]|uniref:cytochrome b-c1 complex subunit 10 n=1 Tax=Drosophila grimshawi TaxID=7222 RepID=UPI000C870843|nr:cytochrome b-c1 complex subunit 10 [Drosophila grimshawi]